MSSNPIKLILKFLDLDLDLQLDLDLVFVVRPGFQTGDSNPLQAGDSGMGKTSAVCVETLALKGRRLQCFRDSVLHRAETPVLTPETLVYIIKFHVVFCCVVVSLHSWACLLTFLLSTYSICS
jgi:hypothetical protein